MDFGKAAYELASKKSGAAMGKDTNNLNNVLLNLYPVNPSQGVNLYNPATAVSGHYISAVDGTSRTDNPSYYASDYIPVKALTPYMRLNNVHIAYYNSNKTFLSGAQLSGFLFTTPANCAFIRVSILSAKYAAEQITEVFPSSTIVPAIPLQVGKNLYNSATTLPGRYVNYITGTIDSSPTYYATDWIPVKPFTTYSSRYSIAHMAFYDAGGVFISGLNMPPGLKFTTPKNCCYVRISILNSLVFSTQIEEGSVSTPYEAYKFTPNAVPLATYADIKLAVAPVIPAVVGREINIYKENIVCVDDINNYQFVFTCAKGTHQNERWTYTPVAGDVGDIAMTISVYQRFNLIATVNTTIRVSAATKGTGQTFKTLIIGDSTTANNTMINELANVLTGDALTITFIGTQGVSPKFHEGYSGRTTNWHYSDPASPFVYSGAFDFAQYLTTKTQDTPDIVVLNLGINDMFTFTDDASALNAISAIISQYDAMVANIKLSNAAMKIAIAVTIPSGNQDAFGSYGAGQTSWRYKLNHRMLTKVLVDYYGGREASNIYLLPLNTNLDIVNNMEAAAAVPINSRNPATIVRQTNGVHPGQYGYYQIADTYYSWLKSIAT